MHREHWLTLVVLCLAVWLVGCDDEEPVRSYRVPKPHVIDPHPQPPRTQRPAMAEQSIPAPPQRGPITYDVPEGWREKPADQMRLAAFDVGDPNASAEVTVIFLRMELDVAGNINRWLRQIGVEPVHEAAAHRMLEAGTTEAHESYHTVLRGEAQAIAVAMIRQGGGWWFVKMTGPRNVVDEHAAGLWRFVRSMEFAEASAAGGGDG